MNVLIDKSFAEDIKKIKDKNVLNQLAVIIEITSKADKIDSIKNIKKLKAANNFYRIRMGDYRIGLIYNEQNLIFVRFLHRKDIYKKFP